MKKINNGVAKAKKKSKIPTQGKIERTLKGKESTKVDFNVNPNATQNEKTTQGTEKTVYVPQIMITNIVYFLV